MRILFIHSELGMLAGGGENFSKNLIKELKSLGYDITAVFTAKYDRTTNVAIVNGINKIPITGYWYRQCGQGILSFIVQKLDKFPLLQNYCLKIQKTLQWRIVRWHNGRFRKKVVSLFSDQWQFYDVAYVHGDEQLASEVAQKLITFLMLPGPLGKDSAKYLKSIHVVCSNGDALQRLQQLFGNKVQELPIGLRSVDFFTPVGDHFRKKLMWNKGEIIVGYVGRFTPLKGVTLLCNAFCEVALHQPSLRLLLIGHGSDINVIQAKLSALGLEDRYYNAGIQNHETLPSWYRSMDIFVMPSLYENFSNAILEAMGCGLPVLASRVGGNVMLVQEEKNGWLFDPGNKENLSSVLMMAIEQRCEWQVMGQISNNLVKDNYSWKHTAAVFERLILPYLPNKSNS